MGRKRKISAIERIRIAAAVDIDVVNDLKQLSKDLNEPIYILVEKALRTFILRQRKFLDARLKREKKQEY